MTIEEDEVATTKTNTAMTLSPQSNSRSTTDVAVATGSSGGDVAMAATSREPKTTAAAAPEKSRFPMWYALTVFSAITLIALITSKTDTKTWFAEEKWVLSVCLLSLVLSCIACLAHIAMRENFVGMPLEGLLLFTELGFWVGGLIVMMDTDNALAVDEKGGIINANLYFGSWASLSATVLLLVRYGEQVNANVMVSSGNIAIAGYWAGISIASLVVVVSSTEIFVKGITITQGLEIDCQVDGGSGYCKRLKFSIALGAVSTIFAVICSMLCFKGSSVVNASASFLVLFSWVLGVAFTTFGSKSPGNTAGNLFFGSWVAFVLGLFMVSTSIKNYLATRRGDPLPEEDPIASSQGPKSDTEKGDDSKPDDEAATTPPSEGPLTPVSTFPKSKSKSDEDSESSAPVANVDVPGTI